MDIEQQVRRIVPDRFESLVSGVRFGQFVSVGVVGAISDNTVLAVLGLVFGVSDVRQTRRRGGGHCRDVLHQRTLDVRRRRSLWGVVPTLRRLLTWSDPAASPSSCHLWLLTQWLTIELVVAGTDLWFIAASPLAIGVAMLVNYVAESIFTWRHAAREPVRNYHTAAESQPLTVTHDSNDVAGWDSQEIPPGS